MAYEYMALKWKLFDSTVVIHDLTKNKSWNANFTLSARMGYSAASCASCPDGVLVLRDFHKVVK
jgi:hypothetical protein